MDEPSECIRARFYVDPNALTMASGDILVLLDALMYRLGEGLSTPPAARPPTEEVRPVADDDAGDTGRGQQAAAELPEGVDLRVEGLDVETLVVVLKGKYSRFSV